MSSIAALVRSRAASLGEMPVACEGLFKGQRPRFKHQANRRADAGHLAVTQFRELPRLQSGESRSADLSLRGKRLQRDAPARRLSATRMPTPCRFMSPVYWTHAQESSI